MNEMVNRLYHSIRKLPTGLPAHVVLRLARESSEMAERLFRERAEKLRKMREK